MSQYLLLFVPALDLNDGDHLSVMPLNPTSTVPVSQRLYADATPEALSHALASGWPSGAVMSAEAGAVFGAHGMGYETIMRNLALLNVLWDGGEIAIDRRSKPSFRLHDRRLTFGLMVQPEAIRGFLERAGTLPRGSGFIARFLIAWPARTQGTRSYRVAPESMPAVERFGLRIRDLLDTPQTTHADGGLQPIELALSPPAHAAWVQPNDRIERALAAGGDFADIRDVAAKAAENVARLAAPFHVLAQGPRRRGRRQRSLRPRSSDQLAPARSPAPALRSRHPDRTGRRHPARQLVDRRGEAHGQPSNRHEPYLPMRAIPRPGRERHEDRASDARRAPTRAVGRGRSKAVRGSEPDADRRVTAVARPQVMITAAGPGALRLLRFLRLIVCGCSALSRRNRSSRKGWGAQRPVEQSTATVRDRFRH